MKQIKSNNLEQLYSLCREIKFLEQEYNRLSCRIVPERRIAHLGQQLDKLKKQVLDAEEVISRIEDPETRHLVRLRCEKGQTWEEIGERMGMDRRTASRKFKIFLEQRGQV